MTLVSTQPRLAHLLRYAAPDARVPDLCDDDIARMNKGVATLNEVLEANGPVYGVTHGFGPLVDYPAAASDLEQGSGLICHLATGQGQPLSPDACRLTVWLRLESMRTGYSAVSVEFWRRLAEAWNRGFVPAIPRDGTVSASGDLQPLAHASLAHTGAGQAWWRDGAGRWELIDAGDALERVGVPPLAWPAREALAFVNGTSVGLAVCMLNHREVMLLVRAAAALTARIASMLGANPQAYHPGVSHARGQHGQGVVSDWIRSDLPAGMQRSPERPLQEAYSLRGAPQVLGAVFDQLWQGEQILCSEATGCTDNPICYEGEVLHNANFHALPVALVSDQLGLCLQQVAFLVERQLALLCAPARNGGLPPMLTPRPGAGSGLAGVQISASSFVGAIRQRVYPATLTAVPTNGDNQDHVPLALNGAVAVSDALVLAWYVVGSLGVAVTQYAAITGQAVGSGAWARLADNCPPLQEDRPLAAEVRLCADLLKEAAGDWLDGG